MKVISEKIKIYVGDEKIYVFLTLENGKVCKGVAQCSENDTYNETTGTQIAHKRAELKHIQYENDKRLKETLVSVKAIEKRLQKDIEARNRIVNDYMNWVNVHGNIAVKLRKDIDNLSK